MQNLQYQLMPVEIVQRILERKNKKLLNDHQQAENKKYISQVRQCEEREREQ